MADAKTAIAKTLINEGGYVNDPADPGGATKFGVTQDDVPGQNIEDLTEEQATNYYLDNFWKSLYSQIQSQDIADKVFDLGVLFGIGTAVKQLQQVLQVSVDGIFGQDTLEATNQADPVTLLSAFKTIMVQHALAVGSANPGERIFVKGWIRRING